MHNKMDLPICTCQHFDIIILVDLIMLEWQIKVFNLFYDSSFLLEHSHVLKTLLTTAQCSAI
jgi:hypothetical protein